MRVSAPISRILKKTLSSSGMQQKELAAGTKTANATVSDHVNGKVEVNFDKAMEYLAYFEEEGLTKEVNELSANYSHSFIGYLKSMDGEVVDVFSIAELDVYQMKESDERKKNKQYVSELIAESKLRSLEPDEQRTVIQYALEYLDEIVVEFSIVTSIFNIVDMTIHDAMKIKMPEWVSKKYMRG